MHRFSFCLAAAAVALVCVAVAGVNGDYMPPEPRDDDPKILSRDVKCLGESDNLDYYALSIELTKNNSDVLWRYLVCRATLNEMKSAIKKIDPRKKVEVSGFRMDSKDTKTVPLVKSESYLTELMETVCKYKQYSSRLADVMSLFNPNMY